MTTRATTEDFNRQRQQQGLRFSLDALEKDYGIAPGKVIKGLLQQEERAKNFLKAKQQEKQALEAERRTAPRQVQATDTEALIKALRKGDADTLDIGPNPLDAIDARMAELDRLTGAAKRAIEVTTKEAQTEIAVSDFLDKKVAPEWRAVAKWRPKPTSTYSELMAQEGKLKEMANLVLPILIAVETLTYGGVTTAEQKAVRNALKECPEKLPRLSDIRAKTQSRIDATPLAQDIERRATGKEQDRERNASEAAEAAKHRVGVKDSAAQAQPEEAEQAAKLEEARA